jgi:hypothetical protein
MDDPLNNPLNNPPRGPEAPLSTQVGMATFAVLTYRLLFCSPRELSLTALLFCAACAWCTGNLVAVAGGYAQGHDFASEAMPIRMLAMPLSLLTAVLRTLCQHAPLAESARETCSKFTDLTWLGLNN